MFHLILITLALTMQSQAAPLEHVAVVDAPVGEVWKVWTTSEGVKSWMVPSAEVDLRVGGHIRTSYSPNSDLKGEDVIENTIICYDPMRMLSIKATKVPKQFPFKIAMQQAWTVIYLEAVGTRTKVTSRMLGFTNEPESVEMRKFFNGGNQMTLDALSKRFQK